MFETLLRTVAVLASLIVLVGWAVFAIDELHTASGQTRAQIAGAEATRDPAPTGREEAARERVHNPVREAIDDANDLLLAPLEWVSDDSSSSWARRTGPALIALLVYGFGLAYLARFSRGRP